MDKKKLQIIVCCHKADPEIRKEPPYYPIQVGKALHPELDLGFQKDNEGDNISEKNNEWCELTALYWGWKNLKNTEYVGLCHYRRYFDYNITEDNIDILLKNKDILLLDRSPEMCSVATRFMELVSMEDFYIFLDVLLKLHPEYKEAVSNYCFNSNLFYRCTMFLARKSIYDDFCETFFPVFEEVEKKIRPHGYSRLNRCIAYLGELSLGIYVSKMRFKVKYVPMKICGQDETQDNAIYGRLKRVKLLKKIKYRMVCFMRYLGFKILHSCFPNRNIYQAVTQGLKSDGLNIDLSNLEN